MTNQDQFNENSLYFINKTHYIENRYNQYNVFYFLWMVLTMYY